MAKEDQSKEELAVRSMRIVFNVERLVDGKLMEVKEVPAMLYEAQFEQTLQSLAAALLEQANRSPEPKAEGEDTKEE
jgi:hypothetical protein